MRGRAINWLPEELAWIEARKDWPRADLHRAFVGFWRRPDITSDNIRQLCVRNKWSAGPEGRRRAKGTSRIFTPAETEWLRANAVLSMKSIGHAFRAAFPGRDITDAQIMSWRKNHKVKTGRTGRFEKGQTPPNKGRKGYCPPGSEKGHFNKGHVPQNVKPLGDERIGKDGYTEIKVASPNPGTGHKTRYIHKHRWLWEAANGPVPSGQVLKCLDGNKLNTDPANWIAIPRGLLPRLNGRHKRNYDSAPAELQPIILTIARLEHAAREARKDAS
jgi:hypothetical protein